MKNEGTAAGQSQSAHKMPWEDASIRSQLSAEPIFTDETGDIITSIDLKHVLKQEERQAERRQEKEQKQEQLRQEQKALLNEQRLQLRGNLFKAGLDEYKLQLALVYADQKPNPYLAKELSKYRNWFGYAKREDVERWASELLAIEKKLEQLELSSIKIVTNTASAPSARAVAAPVTRLVMDRKTVNAVPGSSMSDASPRSSTLAISQRGYQANSTHPFEVKDYRLKWNHVIQQMTPEEKKLASTRFAKARRALEGKRFDPVHKAKLEALFGTEDVPTAFAIHGYMVDRARETEDASLGQDVFKQAYQEALRLLETSAPSRDEQMTARAKKSHEAMRARRVSDQKTNKQIASDAPVEDVVAGLATGPYKVPPLTKELRQERLHRLADRLVEKEQKAKQVEQQIEIMVDKDPEETGYHPLNIPVTPTAEMVRHEEMDKSPQEYAEPDSRVTDWEQIDELVPTTLSQLSEQFEKAFERPEHESSMRPAARTDQEAVEGLRRKMKMIKAEKVSSFVMPEGEKKPSIPASAAAFTRPGRKTNKINHLDHQEIDDIANRLMEVIAPGHKSPTDWVRTELNAVQGREKRAEVLAYLIDTFDLNKSFKTDIVQIKRGTHQEMVDRYEKAIERFIPVFEKSLKNKKLVTKTGVESFVDKIESFAVIK